MSRELETKKLDLLERMRLKYATIPETEYAKLDRGMMNVPVCQITKLVEYIHDELLPSIEKRSGRESEQYKRFNAMEDAMNWCIYTIDLHERVMMMFSNERLLREFLQEKASFYQQELLKYTTAEDLLYGETFMAASRALGKRAVNNLNEKLITPTDAVASHTPSDNLSEILF